MPPRISPTPRIARRLWLSAVVAVSLCGCVAAEQQRVGRIRVELAYSKACFDLVRVNPLYATVLAHLQPLGPILPADRATDQNVPTEIEAALATSYRQEQLACFYQELPALTQLSPKLAALFESGVAPTDAVFAALTARQLRWVDARQQLTHLALVERIEAAPVIAETQESLREDLAAARRTDLFGAAVLSGAAAGSVARHPVYFRR